MVDASEPFRPRAVFDGARDYRRLALARIVAPRSSNLFLGDKGERLEDVAPHLLECDENGLVAEILLTPDAKGEFGILLEADMDFESIHRHLRHFLIVQRERDGRRVLFRFYDPRVLRAFLPVCTPAELVRFFNRIKAFHCQAEEPGAVVSFSLDGDHLRTSEAPLAEFLVEHFPDRHKLAAAPREASLNNSNA